MGCIVLGRGEDDRKVREWLATAAAVPGYIGFAVGRTTFWDALTDWRAGRSTREEAVAAIARRYREWVDIFQAAAAARPKPVAQRPASPCDGERPLGRSKCMMISQF